MRLGVTGVPGVGKSTTIDEFGMNLVAAGHRVAVLAVDPTSKRTGGSILGDKTRMNRLSQEPNAFIRPSPTSGTLGGVTRKTRETMALCEAAGFDVVIVETVGVGQSEIAVADMVDFFLVLLLSGGGDDLQGIKKGIIEIADMIAINKADGDNVTRAERAAAEYRAALQILHNPSSSWSPPVITISGRENKSLDVLWEKILAHRSALTASGEFGERRQRQAVAWMQDMLNDRIMSSVRSNPRVAHRLPGIERRCAKDACCRRSRSTRSCSLPAFGLEHSIERALASRRRSILLTGFGPFPGVDSNATGALIPELTEAARARFPEYEVIGEVLPVEWSRGPQALEGLWPATGRAGAALRCLAGGRGFQIELVGRNLRGARPDASGELTQWRSLSSLTGPAMLASTLPAERILARPDARRISVLHLGRRRRLSVQRAMYHSLTAARALPSPFLPGLSTCRQACRPRPVYETETGSQCTLTWSAAVAGSIEIIAACLEGEDPVVTA